MHTWLRPQELGKGLLGQASFFPAESIEMVRNSGRELSPKPVPITLSPGCAFGCFLRPRTGLQKLGSAVCSVQRSGDMAKVTVCSPGRLPPQ